MKVKSESKVAQSCPTLSNPLYACLLRQLTGGTLPIKPGLSLKEAVERDRQKRSIDQKIKALEAKLRKEKQLNIQMRLNGELKKLKAELQNL